MVVPGLTAAPTSSLTGDVRCDFIQVRYASHPPGNFPNVRAHTSILRLPGFVLEHVQMNHYRIVKIDYDGQLSRHRGFVCDNDDDAIVWAKQLVDEAPVELWSGARFVARLEPRSNTKPR